MTILRDASEVAELIKRADIVAACAQAAETEHSARIQGAAARQAGVMSLVAGLTAGAAALLAAAVAYRAARLQLRITTDQHLARTAAYKHQFSSLIAAACDELRKQSDQLQNPSLAEMSFQLGLNLDFTATRELLAEMTPANYERRSLLGESFQATIFDIYKPLRELYQHAENIKETIKDKKDRNDTFNLHWFEAEVKEPFIKKYKNVSDDLISFRDTFRLSIAGSDASRLPVKSR